MSSYTASLLRSPLRFGLAILAAAACSPAYTQTATPGTGPFTAATAAVGTAAAATNVTFNIGTGGTLPALSNSNVLTRGAANLDFTLGTGSSCTGTVTAGQSCTVSVAFTPSAPGLRRGAVNLFDTGGNLLATAYVSGAGTSPRALFRNGVQSTVDNTITTGRGLSMDGAGNLYVAFASSGNVERYPTGSTTPTVVTTVAGVSTAGTTIDGAGNLFFGTQNTSGGQNGLYRFDAVSSASVLVTSGLDLDNNLSADGAGNLYSTNLNTGDILEFSPPSYAATTLVAGVAGRRFSGMTLDASGNLFAVDATGNTLYELPAGSGALTALYTGSELNAPSAIAVDAAGNLYVANGGGASNVYRFAAGQYTSAPDSTTMQATSGLMIGPDGSLYGLVSGTTLNRYDRTNPSALSYASTAVGSASASQTVTFENDGNSTLSFTVPSSGQNPSLSNNFTLSNSSTCPIVPAGSTAGTLASGASCTVILTYTPTMSGTVSGDLIFTDDSLNAASTQMIAMTGSSIAGLSVTAVDQNVPTGTSSVTLQFTIGYGGNTVPTNAPTVTVSGSATGVGAITCKAKAGHNTCTAAYDTSTLAGGTYTITATQPADSTYTSATVGTATLTMVPPVSHIARPVGGSVPPVTFIPAPAIVSAPVTAARPVVVAPTLAAPMLLAPTFSPSQSFNPDFSDDFFSDNADKSEKKSDRKSDKKSDPNHSTQSPQ